MAVVNPYEVELLTVQYTAALELLLQQMNTRLRGTVQSKAGYVGKMASPIQYLQAVQFKQPAPRGSTLTPTIAQYQRRWVTPNDRDLTLHVDSFDELRTIVDPKSQLSANVQAAANRFFDDLIINAFFGTASIGVDATSLTTETFDSGANFPASVTVAENFGVGSETGLTPKKMIEARRILRKYENDMDVLRPHIGISAQQESDLMSKMEVISTEYRERPVMEDGMIRSFLGFNFHYSERLQFDTSDTDARWVPVWLDDGVHLGVWKEIQTTISLRTDLVSHPWQSYSMVSAGATRLQAGKVVKILCLDASGGALTV
jgi:hypothetical protein